MVAGRKIKVAGVTFDKKTGKLRRLHKLNVSQKIGGERKARTAEAGWLARSKSKG